MVIDECWKMECFCLHEYNIQLLKHERFRRMG
ncbi:hypothetical protein DICVIV_13649 [Dictyocaulus viviparus]|uniref:Uncharacterized protein n=1 Tax=Dictyocaulus viviparus TaxID=29172 RepID=A0A0D8X7A0_DICVI|nr:hypothetical protein DICVIV_13649 [Dictyocaulus viviparus]